jgi:hypothetical protein
MIAAESHRWSLCRYEAMIAKRTRHFLLATLVFGVPVYAQTSSEVGGHASTRTTHQSLQSNLPSVFEMLHTLYRFESDGTGSREVVVKIRILNQMGTRQRASETFEYRPFSEELHMRYVRVRKKGGALINVETNVLQQPALLVRPR